MFLDPTRLNAVSPAEILDAAAHGRLAIDRRFLRTLAERKDQALPALLEFIHRDHSSEPVDLYPEAIALVRHWGDAAGIPVLIAILRDNPEDLYDELIDALVAMGPAAIEPLLSLYEEVGEEQGGEIAFALAHLGVRDDRILKLLISRLEYDLSDTLLIVTGYGDPALLAHLDKYEAEADPQLRNEIQNARKEIQEFTPAQRDETVPDLYEHYEEEADLPVDMLDEDERIELLRNDIDSLRAAAASSFFNRELSPNQRAALLEHARSDASAKVRARCWEALGTAVEVDEVIQAMLSRLRSQEATQEELGGLLVGLSAETDRNEVRQAIEAAYKSPATRAKALEAMWRSVNPKFRDYFAKHLNDADEEVKRAAIWGVGYYGVRSQLDTLRNFFDTEEFRADALFAYALALPGEVSRSRMQSLLSRVERDAHGLSEMEEDLVKVALDEKLMLAGKEPYFAMQED